MFFLLILFCLSSVTIVSMSLKGQTSFIIDKHEIYIKSIISKSITATTVLLNSNKKLIEIEFPAKLKSDISVSETYYINRDFTFKFIEPFVSQYKMNLWVMFPDRKEASITRSIWGDALPFTLTSIEGAFTGLKTANIDKPELIIAVNPGFNIDEWINIAKLSSDVLNNDVPIVIINGNIDRLRNGYYPSIFYPGLTKVTNTFYKTASQAFFLSPIGIAGNRFAGWLAKSSTDSINSNWEILVKSSDTSNTYDVVNSSNTMLSASSAWNIAKNEYKIRTKSNVF